MKLLLLVLFAAVCAQAIKIKWSHNVDVNYDVDEEWENFKKIHNRAFHTNGHEDKRKAIFASNLETIMNHNQDYESGLSSYKMGVNQFTDLTSEEFKSFMLSPMNSTESVSGTEFLPPMNAGNRPQYVNWVNEGYVTPVKNQGTCGSCWAFSAIGAIEGQHFRKTGKLVSLSEQNLVDCSTENFACDGGWANKAFDFVKENSGIDTEESYPYMGKKKDCSFKKDTVGATVSGYVAIKKNSEENLQEAIASVGPISVSINSGLASFRHYHSGVYDDHKCSRGVNHGVLAVGYGSENGKDYYLVKNSWGTSWGNSGYIKMARNKFNQCGIARRASYPLV